MWHRGSKLGPPGKACVPPPSHLLLKHSLDELCHCKTGNNWQAECVSASQRLSSPPPAEHAPLCVGLRTPCGLLAFCPISKATCSF